jgi:hypothetical protein
MIYLETIPRDIKVPFVLKDTTGTIIDFSSSSSDVVDVKAYLKDGNGNLVRSYSLYPKSSDTKKYLIIDNEDNTAYLWITKGDIESQSNGTYLFLGVEVERTDLDVPGDNIGNSVHIIARFTVKIW